MLPEECVSIADIGKSMHNIRILTPIKVEMIAISDED